MDMDENVTARLPDPYERSGKLLTLHDDLNSTYGMGI